MDAEQLRTFLQIVREGSFSKAARALDVTQPTVSARLRALEGEVGGPLLRRERPRPELTELGQTFLPFARRALDAMAQGVEAAQMARTGERGQLNIGTF